MMDELMNEGLGVRWMKRWINVGMMMIIMRIMMTMLIRNRGSIAKINGWLNRWFSHPWDE